MDFRQRDLKVFHQYLLIYRALLTLVFLKRLNELLSLVGEGEGHPLTKRKQNTPTTRMATS